MSSTVINLKGQEQLQQTARKLEAVPAKHHPIIMPYDKMAIQNNIADLHENWKCQSEAKSPAEHKTSSYQPTTQLNTV